MQTKEEPAEAYKATLSQLSSSSKPEINALTMLADDYRDYATSIVVCIENQLKTAEVKLPVMHLIDSICKNFPKSRYVELFTQNIVSNFCYVFQFSDERVRKSLHKLRMTWESVKIFPQRKLEAIDDRVHKMDPNWPVLHKLSSQQRQQQSNNRTADQQSKSLNHTKSQQIVTSKPINGYQTDNQIGTGGGAIRRTANNNNSNRRKKMRSDQNNANLPSNEPIIVAPQPFMDPNIIQATHDIPQVHPTTFMDPSITMTPSDQIQPIPTATFIDPNLMLTPANDPSQLRPTHQIYCGPQFNSNTASSQHPPQQAQQAPQPVTTQSLSVKQPEESQPAHSAVLESLYGGKQCSNCSLRFDDNNRYSIHLDWHFRQNQKTDTVFARRKWYYPLNLWVQFREINDDDLQESDNIDTGSKDLLLSVNDYEVPTAPASKEDEKNICSVCHETFEKFWAEEEEEWRLKNAKMYEDERVYHPLCLMDMLQASAPTLQSCG